MVTQHAAAQHNEEWAVTNYTWFVKMNGEPAFILQGKELLALWHLLQEQGWNTGASLPAGPRAGQHPEGQPQLPPRTSITLA